MSKFNQHSFSLTMQFETAMTYDNVQANIHMHVFLGLMFGLSLIKHQEYQHVSESEDFRLRPSTHHPPHPFF